MTLEELLAKAARERAGAVATRADRPSQRRCAEITSSLAAVRHRTKMQLRSGGGSASSSTYDFAGCAAAYEAPFEMWDMFGPYNEIVGAGACAQSLATPDLDVPLVLQHDPMRRLARTTNDTLQLSEDDEGLQTAAQLDKADADVAYVAPKLQSGLVDEMSIRFTITSGQWSPDYMEYRINSLDIHRGDTSVVGYGANPATHAELRSVVQRLQQGRGLTTGDVTLLTDTLRASSLDTPLVDEAMRALTGYLEVREPDEGDVDELAKLTVAALRDRERGLRIELRRRHLEPAMTLGDLLTVE